MRCTRCAQPAVFSEPSLCREHFIRYLESKVLKTVAKYRLVSVNDNIAVAASGGKDSTTCLYILSKHFRNVVAVAIDEGIKGYRRHTLEDLKGFCRKHKIKLKVYSAKDEFGKSLDMLVRQGRQPCSACGAIRRSMLNSRARMLGATVLATGHNLDDEAQSIMMNLFRNSLAMSARLGPKTGVVKSGAFVQRVKPLHFCSEREITAYVYLMGFDIRFKECPYAEDAYRRQVQGLLNDYERKHPGTKRNIVNNFLKILPRLKKAYSIGMPNACSVCGEPSSGTVCSVCKTFK